MRTRRSTTQHPANRPREPAPPARALLDAMAHPAMLAAPDGAVLRCNALWQATFGLATEEARGEGWLLAVAPAEREETQQAWRATVARGQALTRLVSLRHPGGVYRPRALLARPIPAEDGAAAGWLVTFDAVTPDVVELRGALEIRDEVLAGVSHDLRTPLSSTANAAHLIQRQTSDDRVRQHAGAILRAAGRMERLVRDLLDLAGSDAQRLTLELEELPVRVLLDEARDATVTLARERKVRVQVRTGSEIVGADRARIHRVLTNLVTNAIRYSPPSGIVSLAARGDGSMIRISVLDRGAGVPPANRERIFERFWRHGDASQKGTGLGLFICRQLVEAHGGRIWVAARPGGGSAFHFTLPVAG